MISPFADPEAEATVRQLHNLLASLAESSVGLVVVVAFFPGCPGEREGEEDKEDPETV